MSLYYIRRAVVRLMGAGAFLAVAIIYLTAFDWGSPPNRKGQAFRAVPMSRAR